MSYVILAAIFFFSLFLALVGLGMRAWRHPKLRIFYILWFGAYATIIFFFTGPENLAVYPPAQTSPYKLPWKSGVSRFVAQGNRSFTSHRDFHEHAWDFLMSNGTEVLAARDGQVIKVEDDWDGIGLKSNALTIEHADGTRAIYAHVRHKAARVKVGDLVHQGQVITYSGMVGQTLFPHLHFVVINKEGTESIPIAFSDVPGGIPFAGHVYMSENANQQN